MISRHCVVVLGILLATVIAGCRRDPHLDAYIDQLDAEKRALEDQIYLFRGRYEKAAAELARCREQGAETGGGKAPPGRETDRSPVRRRDEDSDPSLDFDLQPPTVEPGTPADPPPPRDSIGPTGAAASGDRRGTTTTGIRAPRRASPVRQGPGAVDVGKGGAELSHIELNHRYTSGQDFDREPGDDGLSVYIQPRAADDRPLALFGKVTVVLLDPLLSGQEARFAKWDFSADEVSAAMETAAREIRLEMKWPDKPPRHGRLHLFVRLETEQGKRFEANREIYVNLPSTAHSRWTPRPTGAPRDVLVAERPAEEKSGSPGRASIDWSPRRPE